MLAWFENIEQYTIVENESPSILLVAVHTTLIRTSHYKSAQSQMRQTDRYTSQKEKGQHTTQFVCPRDLHIS